MKVLDGLPLALAVVGAYLAHVHTSPTRYLRHFQLLNRPPHLSSHQKALDTACQITLERVQELNQAAVALLRLWSYFDRQELCFRFLRHADGADDTFIRRLVQDEFSFDQAVTLLCKFQLVGKDPLLGRPTQRTWGTASIAAEPARYSMHRILHEWTVFGLGRIHDRAFATSALTCVAWEVVVVYEANPNPTHLTGLAYQRLYRHARASERQNNLRDLFMDSLGWAIQLHAELYYLVGKLEEADRLMNDILQLQDKLLGPNDWQTLRTVDALGSLYFKQKRLAEAQEMYVRAAEGMTEAYGPTHNRTLRTMSRLASVYRERGNSVEAKKMSDRALLRPANWLPSQPDPSQPEPPRFLVADVAERHFTLHEYEEAQTLLTRLLRIQEETPGLPEDALLAILVRLGFAYLMLEYYENAEQVYSRALTNQWGSKHEDTLTAKLNLVRVYLATDRRAKAMVCYEEVLQWLRANPEHEPKWRSRVEDVGRILQSIQPATSGSRMSESINAKLIRAFAPSRKETDKR